MSGEERKDEIKSSATKFLDAHPGLRLAMKNSAVFQAVKEKHALDIDKERFYIVKGDALGDEDELYLDALARGSKEASAGDLSRALFLELKEDEKKLLEERSGKL